MIDLPDVRAEVEAAFAEYERALVANDVATLDRLFLDRAHHDPLWHRRKPLRLRRDRGVSRRPPDPRGLERTLARTVITTYGRDVAVASTLFRRSSQPGRIGRQMQTWVRTEAGWRLPPPTSRLIDDASVRNAAT